MVARGVSQWLTALERTKSSRLQGFIQSHVRLSCDLANTSIRLTQADPIKTAKAQECSSPLAPLENFSARRAAWLFVRQANDLDETQQKELALMRQVSPTAEAAYGLTQAFLQMVREHTGEPLEAWLSLVEESTLPELKSFAKGLQQDKAAMFAGLTLPWSNGPVEGHVNRLKLIKRSMYGRAKLRLLRQRVLHSPPKKRKRTIARVA